MNIQIAAWSNPSGTVLVRQYADGALTIERKVDGVYMGEVELSAVPVGSVA